jgi:hypothetical protein
MKREEKSELIEISSGIYCLENKIKCELEIEDYIECDKFKNNTKGCIDCDCVIIDIEDKYSTEYQDFKNRMWHKDTEVNLVRGENDQLRLKLSTMQNKIEELEKINKSMRNCGNCGNYGNDKCYDCSRELNFNTKATDLWIAKGIK